MQYLPTIIRYTARKGRNASDEPSDVPLMRDVDATMLSGNDSKVTRTDETMTDSTDKADEQGDEAADEALIDRILNKDSAALAEYIQQNHHRLSGFVRSITGEHLLALVEVDDLVQEISTAALAGLETAPLDKYSPMDWLQQLARRRVVDAHRFHFDAKRRDANRQQSLQGPGSSSGKSDAPGLEQLLAASMTSPSAAFSRDVRMMRMQKAIGELGEEQQNAIRMRYAEGLPTKEIAERLGKTDVSVRVLLSRSMRQLEKALDDVRPTR